MSNICIFGDSIVQGVYGEYAPSWAEIVKMRAHTADETHVSTFGISGDTSEGLLTRMQPTLSVAKSCFSQGIGHVVIAIGTNDSQELLDRASGEYVPLVAPERFEANLRELMRISAAFASKTVFVGLLHADETKAVWESRKYGTAIRYRERLIREYDNMIRRVAESTGSGYVELTDAISPEDLPDGLHPHAAAHERIAEFVWSELLKEG